MPYFGAHMSVAGGLHKALDRAKEYGCDVVQIFTASPQIWQVKLGSPGDDNENAHNWIRRALVEDDVKLFRRMLRATKLRCAMAHDSYLINLAATDEVLYR